MNKYLETLSNLKDANKPVENNTELEKIELRIDIKGELKEAEKKAQSFIKTAQKNLTEAYNLCDDAIKAHEINIAKYTDAYDSIRKIDTDLAAGWSKVNNYSYNISKSSIKTFEKMKSEIAKTRSLVR